ncbi:chemotaxis protein CheB [Pseudomonas sp.]|uniref:chemotaxis protein CheB n=1 Tax=Pseudomonas sp. TaxID=306 RepID=UPI0027304A92|nr:chemotaxis protein CheB [Pseudomonas sp.]MDP2244239.1 CheR family methyltransferase [Pseudomonas sp.]
MAKRKTGSAHMAQESKDARTADGQLVIGAGDLPANNACAFPIVGIGASAGGLAAFEAFFSGMPTDTNPNMAFVLVQHLAPDHKSMLTDLIRRFTRMQVFEVVDGMQIQLNCAYIIPPNHDMAFINGTLQLLSPSEPRGQRLPIDFFFRSLALDQRERAIGIVLSGTGSDGTLGVRAIKAEGGMVMAQDPDSAEFDGMPRSAIATGLVDYVLPPAEMPVQLMAYRAHAFGKPPLLVSIPSSKAEDALKKIFIALRTHVGHDFSQYKPSTILRRIERRMAVHQLENIDSYVKYLHQTPREVESLFRDLLIGVTNFFRDPAAFKALEELVIPKLFAANPPGSAIRVWSTGCSTGEEAYSLAILLQEYRETLQQDYTVQVFATDIDSRAIATARAGIYPASMAADISPERLKRFFSLESDGSGYRIHKSIRDMLVFSEQDLIKDPPFSKLDLICCRNLLIYLGAELQKKIIPLFHYALKPGGILFLGTSEGVGDFDELFNVLDRKSKLYQRKEDFSGMRRTFLSRFLSPVTAADMISVARRPGSAKAIFPSKLPLREITEQALLQHLAAVAALVNAQGDILYLHGRSGMFLEPAPGEAGINNILKMAREGLHSGLATSLHKAAASKEVVRVKALQVKTNGHVTSVNLTIWPVKSGPAAAMEASLFLVILEEASALAASPTQPITVQADAAAENSGDIDPRLESLKQELQSKEDYLQSIIEALETSSEELKSSNEEMQSVNEELQSTNEELETSKEELQSVNEELATINAELQTKVLELSQANNDMNNLLAGTGIGTVFVDLNLRILRFTPAASRIINLIPSDVGRPVGHIASNLLGYDRLVTDVKAVLDTLTPKEIDVQTVEGRWYKMRILPYRTLDNVIEGAVITYVDINEHETLRLNEERYRLAAKAARDVIWDWDIIKGEQRWNEAGISLFGWTDIVSVPQSITWWLERLHPEDRQRVNDGIQAAVADSSRTHWDDEYRFRKVDGTYAVVLDRGFVLRNERGQAIRMIGAMLNISARKQAEEALRVNEERLRVALEATPVVIFNQDQELRYTWIYNAKSAVPVEQFLGKTDAELLPAEAAANLTAIKRQVLERGEGTRRRVNANIYGEPIPCDMTVEPLRDDAGAIIGITGAVVEVTEQPH